MALIELRCPSCSAPLPPLRNTQVTCDYCHLTCTLDAQGEVAQEEPPAKRTSAPATAGRSEATPGSPFGARLLSLLRALALLTAGAAALAIPVAFERGAPGDLVVAYALAIGLGTLTVAFEKQKLLATLLAASAGVFLVAKPWAQPLIRDGAPFSPTSETACYFLVPGGLLLGLALLLGLSLRGADLKPGSPRQTTLALFGLGVLLAAAWFSQPTEAQVAAHRAEQWQTLRQQLGAALQAEAPLPQTPSGDFSELRFEDHDPRGTNTVQFLSLGQLEDPAARSAHFYPGGEDLLLAWRAGGLAGLVDDRYRRRVASERFTQTIERAGRARYVVLYRVGEAELEVLLFDCQSGELRLRSRVPCENPNGIVDGTEAVLEFLRALPGAEVPAD